MCFYRCKSPSIPRATQTLRRFEDNRMETDANIDDQRRELKQKIINRMKDKIKRTYELSVDVETPGQKRLYGEMVDELRDQGYKVHSTERIYRANGKNVKVLEWFL